MSQIEKKLKKWGNKSNKQPVPISEVGPILYRFFEGYVETGQSGSHSIRIEHPALRGKKPFDKIGCLNITISKGQYVKKEKIYEILLAIELVKSYEK